MRFIIAAGGTGGHITPGLAIGQALKDDGHDVLFVGTEDGMEKSLVPKAGFEIKFVHADGLKMDFKQKLNAIFEMNRGVTECKKIINEYGVDVCIGTGGYVTAPLMFAALALKIPTIIHESNALPGKTTKLFAPYINCTALGFEAAKSKLPKAFHPVVTGNPSKMGQNTLTKEEAKLKININDKLVLVFGGSQGAKKINEIMQSLISCKQFKDCSVIYATGPKNYESVKDELVNSCSDSYTFCDIDDDTFAMYESQNRLTFTKSVEGNEKNVQTIDMLPTKNVIIVKRFIYNMEEVMKAADVVISRSGALTCTEISEVGVASILIPYPYAAENHQYFNAKTLADIDAGVVIEEKDLTAQILIDKINEVIFDDDKLQVMAQNSTKLRKGKPIENIKAEIYRLIKK